MVLASIDLGGEPRHIEQIVIALGSKGALGNCSTGCLSGCCRRPGSGFDHVEPPEAGDWEANRESGEGFEDYRVASEGDGMAAAARCWEGYPRRSQLWAELKRLAPERAAKLSYTSLSTEQLEPMVGQAKKGK